MKKLENVWLKKLFIILGSLTLILGITGIFLPLLPTTPFLLLTAYFYGKSSEKFYNKLLNNKIVGKYITDFKDGKGISMKTKVISIFTLWFSIIICVLFIIDILFVKLILVSISSAVTYYLISLNTLEE